MTGLFAAGAALLLSHTFYVTSSTYVWGLVLLLISAFLFWLRFRRRMDTPKNWLTVISNICLCLLTLLVILYFLGVATWFE